MMPWMRKDKEQGGRGGKSDEGNGFGDESGSPGGGGSGGGGGSRSNRSSSNGVRFGSGTNIGPGYSPGRRRTMQGSNEKPACDPGTTAHSTATSLADFAFWETSERDTSLLLLSQLRSLASMGVASLCAFGLVTLLALLYVTVRPFSKPTYRRLSATLAAAAFLDAMALLAPNMSIFLTGDSDVPSPVGASVLVCNHLMSGDWWATFMLGRCVGLRGSTKVFLRNEMLQGISSSDSAVSTQVATASSSSSSGSSNVASRQNGVHSAAGSGTHSSSVGSITENLPSDGSEVPVLVKLGGYLLHTLLEFPVLSSESSQNWVKDRSELLTLLRSFADGGAPAPVHLLLFPEGWSLEGETDRRAAMAKSIEFAKRESRPQLKHLLLPRTKGFNACLESLRESNPIIYDVTMAHHGYDGSASTSPHLSWPSLWDVVRGHFPTEVHFRIKRYSLGEVMGDAQWLDKQWEEKDRLLQHFAKYQQFPADPRGFCRQRVFHTRSCSLESSFVGLTRLCIIPLMIPVILLLAIPLFWVFLWLYLAYRGFEVVFGWDGLTSILGGVPMGGVAGQTPRSQGTPFFPATPWSSPNQHMMGWASHEKKKKRISLEGR